MTSTSTSSSEAQTSRTSGWLMVPRHYTIKYVLIRVCEEAKPQPTLQGGLPNDPAIVQHSENKGPAGSSSSSLGGPAANSTASSGGGFAAAPGGPVGGAYVPPQLGSGTSPVMATPRLQRASSKRSLCARSYTIIFSGGGPVSWSSCSGSLKPSWPRSQPHCGTWCGPVSSPTTRSSLCAE